MSFRYPFVVSLASVDAAGVLFYPELFRYAHDAYEAMMAEIGFSLSGVLAADAWRLPIGHAEADLERPLAHGDHVVVEVRVTALSAHSFRVSYVFRGADARIHARVMTVHVAVAAGSGKVMPLPVGLRDALTPLSG